MIPSRGEVNQILWELPVPRLLDAVENFEMESKTVQPAPAGPTAKPCLAEKLAVDPHVKLVSLHHMRHQLAEPKTWMT